MADGSNNMVPPGTLPVRPEVSSATPDADWSRRFLIARHGSVAAAFADLRRRVADMPNPSDRPLTGLQDSIVRANADRLRWED